jgi:small subunit ribosomal protein S8
MVTDPIADYLTRIRNAVMANHRVVDIPKSKVKVEMTKILFEKGYILNYKVEDETRPGTIKIALKYHPVTKLSAINNLTRIRKYVDAGKLPRVLNGLGIAIISTSQGIMTDKEARVKKVGGEVLCFIS